MDSPRHIISAQICEIGVTPASDYCRIACWNLIFCVRSWKIDFRGLHPSSAANFNRIFVRKHNEHLGFWIP